MLYGTQKYKLFRHFHIFFLFLFTFFIVTNFEKCSNEIPEEIHKQIIKIFQERLDKQGLFGEIPKTTLHILLFGSHPIFV